MAHARIAILLLVLAPFIACHGGGMYYVIDGVNYTGAYYVVRNNQTGSIQRDWNWDELNYTDTGIACGNTGKPLDISYHAPIQAGNIIDIDYLWWAHPYGPMVAYLAACPAEGCESVDIHKPIWFKIWQAGLLSGTFVDGVWPMKDVQDTKHLKIPVPAAVKPGKYLLKHDMINLQTGPVQIFTNCIQLEVHGSGSSLPKDADLVAFPGAYDKDAGLSWPPYNKGAEWFYHEHKNDTHYPMPGPPLWQG